MGILCIESAGISVKIEILVLICSDVEVENEKELRWMPLTDQYTRKEAQLLPQVFESREVLTFCPALNAFEFVCDTYPT